MASEFSRVWGALCSQVEARNQRLLAELEASWSDIDLLSQQVDASLSAGAQIDPEAASLSSLRALFHETAQKLLLDPYQQYLKRRPQQHTLTAHEDHESGLEQVVRQLPSSLEISGREVFETLRGEVRGPWRKSWWSWRKRPDSLPLRGITRASLRLLEARRARPYGAHLLLMAQTSLALIDPWEIISEEALQRLSGSAFSEPALRQARDRWRKQVQRRRQRADRVLAALRKNMAAAPGELARWLLKGPPAAKRLDRMLKHDRLLEQRSYWVRQKQAVMAQLDLDVKLVGLAQQTIREIEQALTSLGAEEQELTAELDTVVDWLQAWQPQRSGRFPPARAELSSARDHCREWQRGVSRAARLILPPRIETIRPERALPGWRRPWRTVRPLELFIETLDRAGPDAALPGFQEAEDVHRSVIREIERAREVVTYGLELAETEGERGQQVAQEAVQNAQSLLAPQRETPRNLGPVVEAGLVRGTADTFFRLYVAVDQNRLGLLAHMARQGGRRSAKMGAKLALAHGHRYLNWLWQRTRDGYRWVLVRIGWEQPAEPRLTHVEHRSYLGRSLDFDSGLQELPMIYQRLFRVEPVEDPRFLVGRDAEMAAVSEARDLWDAGKAVSVLIVGERGSGKTSLLNCALVRVFRDAPLIRGRCCKRIRSADEMTGFLRDLLDVPPEQDLRLNLTSHRRIVILEEAERTFLRHVEGFGGISELLSLIADTSRSTLWVLAMNLSAFRLLDGAVRVGQYFSHRINAMSVEPQQLTDAILLRHNLSGLRLHFAPSRNRSARVERLKKLLRIEEKRQEVFFEALYRESDGVFRAAFELWRRYIERAEGGILYLRHPTAADYGPLLTQLGRDDLFSLQAILQHGSLEPREHALVLGLGEEASRNHLALLAGREIIEPEPEAPGWRVRPEAGNLVRRALYAENLL